jgi:phage terminase large subunit-like protein
MIREAAENDLVKFISLVAPHRVLGDIHKELIEWWMRSDAKDHQLALLPRDHQKSAMIAYRVAWHITRHPDTTVLYVSATSGLAIKQLKMIKDILTDKVYRKYWPEMVNERIGQREKWTETEISVDHPKRKEEGVRDSTVMAVGLTTSITGFHFKVAVLDDVVVIENAYTTEGREKVKTLYSLLSSIETTDTTEEARQEEWVVGTRYEPRDLYNDLIGMTSEVYSKEGELIDEKLVFDVFEQKVEDRGDGTGEFLWPRQKRYDGAYFGFNTAILMKKKAKYLDQRQYRAQYYNDPNDPDNQRIDRSKFQYYDKKFVKRDNGYWYFKDERLNVYAAIDFAFTTKASSDFTAIVVVGISGNGDIYVLDIDRFKTDRVPVYFERIRDMFNKWNFRKLRAETTSGQSVIVKELKNTYFKPYGLEVKVDEFSPSRREGTKEERLATILEPRYENNAVWHYRGGYCSLLEEELIYANPSHDDIKDALAGAIDIAVPPMRNKSRSSGQPRLVYNSRFGGVAH